MSGERDKASNNQYSLRDLFSTVTNLRVKLIKIGAKVVRHAVYVTFQMVEVAIPRKLFRQILDRIRRLRTMVPVLEPG